MIMNSKTLYVCDEQGEFVPASADTILAAAKTQLRRRVRRGTPFNGPSVVRDFLMVTLGDRDCEYFCVLLLDSRHRLLRFVELFRGTIDGASVHPREVVKTVIEAQAAAVVLVHNHPSQIAEPSAADELITTRLRTALNLIDVRVLDHLIVAGADVVSFAERGLM
jgi:DNA repair protein RadC